MLRNLLSNAIRYTREGQVRVECRVEDSQVLITVSDTGVGIADEDQERIFEEFHQLDNPARDRQQGLGLGLAIVRRLSGLLEHPLHLQSAPGRGSSFTLELPRTEAMEEGVAESPRPGVTGWVGEVVVLDDERPIREGLAHMLRAWGMRVHLAGTVQELYEILDVHQPQLLLSDYRLAEGISGLDLVTDLLARPGNELRALLLTGDSAPEELARIHAAGVRVLNKPVASKDLRSAIDAEMAAETVS
jgi:CheY-like chemotaxis protein